MFPQPVVLGLPSVFIDRLLPSALEQLLSKRAETGVPHQRFLILLRRDAPGVCQLTIQLNGFLVLLEPNLGRPAINALRVGDMQVFSASF